MAAIAWWQRAALAALGALGGLALSFGVALGLLETGGLVLPLALSGGGFVACALTIAAWMRPRSLLRCFGAAKAHSRSGARSRPRAVVGVHDAEGAHATTAMSGDGDAAAADRPHHEAPAETLLKSIRGIPYLIHAIQYSLEMHTMSEQGAFALKLH